MFLPGTLKVNDSNRLEMGGIDLMELVEKYGTPLYLMDEELIRKNCQLYQDTMGEFYDNYEIIYAGKAFLTTAMCALLEEENMSLDVVSGGELYSALKADYPAERLYFHGNNKSSDELKMAIDSGVGRIVIDSFNELNLLDKLAEKKRKKVNVYLRVKPGIEAHTHEYIQTGQMDSKFGLGLSDGQAMKAVKQVKESSNLELVGLHCHIGSQIFDIKPFSLAAATMMEFMAKIREETGVELKELDLGGGFGIRYTREDNPSPLKEFLSLLANTVNEKAIELNFPKPKILLEPGRSIVGEAGVTLYTVGTIKEVPGIRKYISVDGGMMDNLRAALYQAKYEALVANKANDEPIETVSIAGKACESGDMLIWDIDLPRVEKGDCLAVLSTGAYHYSMSNNYNRFCRPPVLFVRDGQADVVVKGETFEDLTRNDVIPSRLREESSKLVTSKK